MEIEQGVGKSYSDQVLKDSEILEQDKEIPEGKVDIPDECYLSDDGGDSFCARLKGIGALNENTQVNPVDENSEEQLMWNMEIDDKENEASGLVHAAIKEQMQADNKICVEEVLINSQESVITDDGKNNDIVEEVIEGSEQSMKGINYNEELLQENIPEKTKIHEKAQEIKMQDTTTRETKQTERRSERNKKEILLTTTEKCEAMAGKRNLEGLYEENDKEIWRRGANDMLRIAKEMLTRQTTRQVNILLLQDSGSDHEDSQEDN